MILFQLPDNRLAYIQPDAVTAVYDQPATESGEWRRTNAGTPSDAITNGQGFYWHTTTTKSCVVVIGQTNLVVPYSAEQAMAILESTS